MRHCRVWVLACSPFLVTFAGEAALNSPSECEAAEEAATAIEADGDGPGTAAPGKAAYTPLTGKERWNLYVRNTYWSPGAFFRAAGPALGGQLSNKPPQWGQGMEGYSKRFGNRFGRFAIQGTLESAGAAALGHEVRYMRSTRSGFLPRAAHAISANFVTYNRDGHRTMHVSRIGAVFAAEFTGNLWMPDGYRSSSKALNGVAIEFGVTTGTNLIREFAPELKRLFRWK